MDLLLRRGGVLLARAHPWRIIREAAVDRMLPAIAGAFVDQFDPGGAPSLAYSTTTVTRAAASSWSTRRSLSRLNRAQLVARGDVSKTSLSGR